MKKLLLILLCSVLCMGLMAQEDNLPDAPAGAPLVVDYAGVLGDRAQALSDSLKAFKDSTSTEILIVTVKDLGDEDPTMYGTYLGRKWGIGQKGKNNGVVLVIKPKTEDSQGQVGIAVGYGLEGALTDATSKRIIQQEIIPHFRENDYYGGASAAVRVIEGLVRGEFTQDQYAAASQQNDDDFDGDDVPWWMIILMFFLACFAVVKFTIMYCWVLMRRLLNKIFPGHFPPQPYYKRYSGNFMAGFIAAWITVFNNMSRGRITFGGGRFGGGSRGFDDDFGGGGGSFSGGSYGGGSFGGGGAKGTW